MICLLLNRLLVYIFLTNHPHYAGESVFSGLSNSFYPLYFTVSELKEVMSTEQPCDLAYEFKDGLLDLPDFPHGFPKPGESYCIRYLVKQG